MFTVAIIFTLIPAYLLSLNLLFILAAMLLGMMMYNALIAGAGMRRLHASAHAGGQLFAGRAGALLVSLSNKGGAFSVAYAGLTVESDDSVEVGGTVVDWLPAGEDQVYKVAITPDRRGLHTVSGLVLSSSYPFGLFQSRLRLALDAQVLVYPAPLEHVPPELTSRRREVGAVPRNSEDYLYLSAYQPGDDVRRIHWKKSAGPGPPVVKRDLAQLQSLTPHLFVPDPCPHFEYAVSALATHFYNSHEVDNWLVVTNDGLVRAQDRAHLLHLLALVEPVKPEVAARDFRADGLNPIYASQLSPEELSS